jgi:hypothetical protein
VGEIVRYYMFEIPRANVIQSDEGFSVEVVGRTGLMYTEGSKSLDVDSEVLAGPSGLVIYADSIRSWNPPHQDEAIDESKRDAIVENIRRAFRFRGLEIEILRRSAA